MNTFIHHYNIPNQKYRTTEAQSTELPPSPTVTPTTT